MRILFSFIWILISTASVLAQSLDARIDLQIPDQELEISVIDIIDNDSPGLIQNLSYETQAKKAISAILPYWLSPKISWQGVSLSHHWAHTEQEQTNALNIPPYILFKNFKIPLS